MNRIVRHLRYVIHDVLLGRIKAGRGLTVFPDDVFVVSYPRSGSTWTRFLIGNLVNPDHPVDFLNLESRIPNIYEFPDRVLRSLPRPRILKSHEYFDPRYKAIIYIVRDPRDVAVSEYYFRLKWRTIPEGYPMDDFVPRLIAGEFDEWQKGACWGDQVLSWLATRRGTSGFLMLRYEDLLKNPEGELANVASFLNINGTPERLARAVQLSSAERMRRLEKKQSHEWVETKRTRQDKPFVRSATSGGWRSVLSETSIAAIEAVWGHVMQMLGYELGTAGVSRSGITQTAKLS